MMDKPKNITIDAANKAIDDLSNKHAEHMKHLREQLGTALAPGTSVNNDVQEKLDLWFGEAQTSWDTEVKTAYANVKETIPVEHTKYREPKAEPTTAKPSSSAKR